ncbi:MULTISPECIES: prephenate dehydratase [unclassified Adlercreutzia]|uniref:prephenate dehydratase n=1 Tax=unclassified Adlercreutzia TaxID=2636013 RepID=UPI0013EAAF42|nr:MULTISPECIES: prephenate dehydratase [unclassified Adlercreutzia]
MSTQPVSIAYLGPKGTYCNEAACAFAKRMGLEDATFVECVSFDDVFDYVNRGKCTYGVVGKENSIEGPVTATLDNFAFNTSANILAEHVVDIHHCLVLHPDACIDDVTTVASHTQGLAQCRKFIAAKLPGRTTISTSSTAESARLAVSDKCVAGIANAYAAELYGAKVVERGIEDHCGNQTSFALIGQPGSAPQLTGSRYKTTLALFLQRDKAGALHMILSEFAYAGINLSMIQSRPTKQVLGDYMFFIEFEGSVNDLSVQTALNCLRLKLREVKVIGSYPMD